jgi:hypothetical protein
VVVASSSCGASVVASPEPDPLEPDPLDPEPPDPDPLEPDPLDPEPLEPDVPEPPSEPLVPPPDGPR